MGSHDQKCNKSRTKQILIWMMIVAAVGVFAMLTMAFIRGGVGAGKGAAKTAMHAAPLLLLA